MFYERLSMKIRDIFMLVVIILVSIAMLIVSASMQGLLPPLVHF